MAFGLYQTPNTAVGLYQIGEICGAKEFDESTLFSSRWFLVDSTKGWLATSASGCPGAGVRRAAEVLQTALESFDEVGIDGWLSFGVAARWLGPGLLGLVDAEC